MVPSRSVIAVAQDPGGAAALAPFLSALEDDERVDLIVYAYQQGREVFVEQRVACLALDQPPSTAEADWAELARGLLATHQPDLVITGTSFDPGPELAMIRVSRETGVRCLTVLDAWTNYRRRFLMEGETDLSDELLPDVIAVMDDFAVREMQELGFPVDRLRVVGQPAFDRFLELARSWEHGRGRQALRHQLGARHGETLVAFFSQPIAELYGPPGSPTYRGYDEWDALRGLLRAMALLVSQGKPMRLAVKLHPKEPVGKYADLLVHVAVPAITVQIADADSLALTADVVVGMTSIVLVKAFLAGRLVISLQPNLVGTDALVLGRAGYLEPVTDLAALPQALQSALSGMSWSCENRLLTSLTDGQSVARLRALMWELLNSHDGGKMPVVDASGVVETLIV